MQTHTQILMTHHYIRWFIQWLQKHVNDKGVKNYFRIRHLYLQSSSILSQCASD